MRTLIRTHLGHLLLAAAAVVCAAIATKQTPAMAAAEGQLLAVPEHQQELLLPKRLPEPVQAVEVLRALRSWNRSQTDEVLRPWANAIADVSRSRDEAITLASIASNESQFLPWVLDYSCNDRAWREKQAGWQRGACDNGWAVGPWQRHSRKLVGATYEATAQDAAVWLRAFPQAWTTWRVARAQARAWLGSL